MNILVYDVAASNGGAETVLREYCKDFIKNTENQYYLLLSLCKIESEKNLHPIYFPWIKRSWFHRIYFDLFIAPRLIVKYRIDTVLSLQNTLFPRIRVNKTVLVHNVLPFVEYRFSLFKAPLLWINQQLIGRIVILSIRRADLVLVQTEWMKHACAQKARVVETKIQVKAPSIHPADGRYNGSNLEGKVHFFYPSNAAIFKNHSVLVNACCLLYAEIMDDFEVLLTLAGNENGEVARLARLVSKEKLPIIFGGWLKQEQVRERYRNSILLFPSYIETVGLPLLEAMEYGTPIIVADCAYSRSIVGTYENANFFDYDNPRTLADLMKKLCISEQKTIKV